ncbi:hypothetical protein [Streptomyces luteogriseus]|uniref:hypothetical protein n=1 Tax=Streptomyces luteogriseus TaxID=68233 RepID=UPI0037196602
MPFEDVMELALGVFLGAEGGERVVARLVEGGERIPEPLRTGDRVLGDQIRQRDDGDRCRRWCGRVEDEGVGAPGTAVDQHDRVLSCGSPQFVDRRPVQEVGVARRPDAGEQVRPADAVAQPLRRAGFTARWPVLVTSTHSRFRERLERSSRPGELYWTAEI